MTINTIAKRTGLSAHTLRYYEKIGLLVNIRRDSKGHRQYGESDMVWIEFIKRLKATSMPLKEMKRFADLRSRGDATIDDRLTILENHWELVDAQVEALKIHRQKIIEKMELCKKGGALQR